MTKYKINKAFSMVEMMLLLVIASLIVAASVPIITKKHIHLPSLANHGSYACYYKDGHLWETRKSGRGDQKVLSGYPRETASCVFEPPTKVMMFQITAIGGGGGGGDAGYNGSMPSTYENTESQLKPFGLDYGDLIDIGVDNSNDAFQEVENYMGQIWGFAQAADSGKAGITYYSTIEKKSKDFSCPQNQKKYKTEYIEQTVGPIVLCSGADDGQQEVSIESAYICKKNGEVVGGYVTYPSVTSTCTKETTRCVVPTDKKCTCEKEVITGYDNVEATYYTTYISGYTEPKEIPCTNPCQYLGQTNCNSGKCYTEKEPIIAQCNCPNNECPNSCIKTPAHQEPKYENTTYDCDCPCENTTINENYEESTPPESVFWGDIEGDGVECTPQDSANFTAKYPKKVEDGCNIETTHVNEVVYKTKSHVSDYSKGFSPFCTTGAISGKTGLSYSYYLGISNISANDGNKINKNQNINGSFCGDVGDCGPSVGYNFEDCNEVLITIGGNTNSTKSCSAKKGATGDKLKQVSEVINIYSNAEDYESKTYYYDEVLAKGALENPGSDGVDGDCGNTPNYKKYDCRRGKSSERVGYCLKHYNTSDNDAELNGIYSYHNTYETNSLPKGQPGEPGEFKTTIIRSLNGIDTTISIGRGGSGAAVSLGKNGSQGSATTFGALLRAEGGEGGKGSQPAISEELPKYDGSIMDFNKLKSCFTTTTYNDDATCIGWKENPNGIKWYKNTSTTSDIPATKVTTVGGMFNFILASFGVSNDQTIQDIMNYAGRGGSGGGVEHFCWAGQYILTFEGQVLYKTSVYQESNVPPGKGVPENHIIPDGSSDKGNCYTSYRNIPAGAGYDGALIITW